MWNRYSAGLLFTFLFSLSFLSCGLTNRIIVKASGRLSPTSLLSPASGLSGSAGKLSLTVVDYNMDHNWPKFLLRRERMDTIVRELRRINPDIVFLQEASIVKGDNAAEYIAGKIGFNSVYARANGNAGLIGFEEGEAVITRFSVIGIKVHRLKPKPGFFENRICLRATLNTPAGPLNVYCTHFSHKEERDALRYKQAGDLLRFIKSDSGQMPLILAGDFNSTPLSDVYGLIKSSGFLDAALLFNSGKGGTEVPFYTSGVDSLRDTAAKPDKRIDYIFFKSLNGGSGSYSWEVSDYYGFLPDPVKLKYKGNMVPFWISDHVGIVLTLREVNAMRFGNVVR